MPFLDKEFINTAMSIDPEWKMVSFIDHLLILLLPPSALTELFQLTLTDQARASPDGEMDPEEGVR